MPVPSPPNPSYLRLYDRVAYLVLFCAVQIMHLAQTSGLDLRATGAFEVNWVGPGGDEFLWDSEDGEEDEEAVRRSFSALWGAESESGNDSDGDNKGEAVDDDDDEEEDYAGEEQAEVGMVRVRFGLILGWFGLV